jgi:NADPH:quinone reductase-like Zn-dependent oxidoreductase
MFPKKKGTMQGIVITQRPKIGELSNDLQLVTVEIPEPKKREVLIKVLFATITIDDINLAEGTEFGGIPIGASPSSKKPVIPGIELSGIVEKIGTNVTKFKIGDSVFGSINTPAKRYGTWATYCCTKEKYLIQKPDYLTYSEAAACAGSGVVACSAIIQGCNLERDNKVLIVGASGGVGTLAVQIAKQKGAYVIAVCSKKNEELVESLGADRVIDYTSTSFSESLIKENNKMAFVVDFVGGKEIEKDGMKVLKKSGKFLTAVGPVRYIGDNKLGWKGITKYIFYICWRILQSQYKKPKYGFVTPTKSIYPIFMEILKANTIKPIIDKIINFNKQEIKEAVNYVKTHRTKGKVVIQITHT